jgi:hypothetical protein
MRRGTNHKGLMWFSPEWVREIAAIILLAACLSSPPLNCSISEGPEFGPLIEFMLYTKVTSYDEITTKTNFDILICMDHHV